MVTSGRRRRTSLRTALVSGSENGRGSVAHAVAATRATEVPTQVDASCVYPCCRRDAVGIEVRDDPEIDADHRRRLRQAARHSPARARVTADAPDHEHAAVARRIAEAHGSEGAAAG